MEERQVLFRSDTIAVKLQSDYELCINDGDVPASFSLTEGRPPVFCWKECGTLRIKKKIYKIISRKVFALPISSGKDGLLNPSIKGDGGKWCIVLLSHSSCCLSPVTAL
jgi:hypothetical protein